MKTLERVFRKPLLESGLMPKDVVERLFPNLDDVIQIHSSYNSAMRYSIKPINLANYSTIICTTIYNVLFLEI